MLGLRVDVGLIGSALICPNAMLLIVLAIRRILNFSDLSFGCHTQHISTSAAYKNLALFCDTREKIPRNSGFLSENLDIVSVKRKPSETWSEVSIKNCLQRIDIFPTFSKTPQSRENEKNRSKCNGDPGLPLRSSRSEDCDVAPHCLDTGVNIRDAIDANRLISLARTRKKGRVSSLNSTRQLVTRPVANTNCPQSEPTVCYVSHYTSTSRCCRYTDP